MANKKKGPCNYIAFISFLVCYVGLESVSRNRKQQIRRTEHFISLRHVIRTREGNIFSLVLLSIQNFIFQRKQIVLQCCCHINFFTFPFHSDKYVETETIVATATYVIMQYVLLIDNNSLSFRLLFVERTKNSKSVKIPRIIYYVLHLKTTALIQTYLFLLFQKSANT